MKTIEGPIPARVLSPFFDVEGWLGPEATLDADLTLSRVGGGGWSAEFRATLRPWTSPRWSGVDSLANALVERRNSPSNRLDGGSGRAARDRAGSRRGGP